MLPYLATHKPARLRQGPALRDLIREYRLQKEDLVMPLFFNEGKVREPVNSMPGIEKMPLDYLLKEIEALQSAGIKAILLFGSASRKDALGSSSYDEDSLFHQAMRAIKKSSDIILITDVCLCAYTDHGHCGIMKSQNEKVPACRQGSPKDFVMDNEKTVETLAKIALSYAACGADIVAPSAMADGQVRSIREAFDRNGFSQTLIMSYSAKYASSFYGPFRDIYHSSPMFGDRRNYQMDPGNKREALKEALLDAAEGADIVMVKPALSYLDIISAVRDKITLPVAAYNVSGEYAMVKAAAEKGWLDEKTAALEILESIKRAGADIIITYWAKEAVKWISSPG